jgi:hypothetical protein
MALVKRLSEIKLAVDMPHSEAECTYSIVTGSDGSRLLQIDTYGSRKRRMQGKKSQSIRFSPEALRQLKAIVGALA